MRHTTTEHTRASTGSHLLILPFTLATILSAIYLAPQTSSTSEILMREKVPAPLLTTLIFTIPKALWAIGPVTLCLIAHAILIRPHPKILRICLPIALCTAALIAIMALYFGVNLPIWGMQKAGLL